MMWSKCAERFNSSHNRHNWCHKQKRNWYIYILMCECAFIRFSPLVKLHFNRSVDLFSSLGAVAQPIWSVIYLATYEQLYTLSITMKLFAFRFTWFFAVDTTVAMLHFNLLQFKPFLFFFLSFSISYFVVFSLFSFAENNDINECTNQSCNVQLNCIRLHEKRPYHCDHRLRYTHRANEKTEFDNIV